LLFFTGNYQRELLFPRRNPGFAALEREIRQREDSSFAERRVDIDMMAIIGAAWLSELLK
jgi:hypothetical protein